MGWGLRLNGLDPGAKWDASWGKMGCSLGLNVLVREAKWVMPRGKMGCALGIKFWGLRQYVLGPGAKRDAPWG